MMQSLAAKNNRITPKNLKGMEMWNDTPVAELNPVTVALLERHNQHSLHPVSRLHDAWLRKVILKLQLCLEGCHSRSNDAGRHCGDI